MHLSLISYFDTGQSFGISDNVFHDDQLATLPDPDQVGISNPLGRGLLFDLLATSSQIVGHWRATAVEQVEDVETGWSTHITKDQREFDDNLRALIQTLPFSSFTVTVLAMGTASVEIRFGATVDVRYIRGVARCFEFAAYTPTIADELYMTAREYVARHLNDHRSHLISLSRREHATDPKYDVSKVFTGFTPIFLAIDPGDRSGIKRVRKDWKFSPHNVVEFEYHGRLHYGWSACLLEPRHLEGRSSMHEADWAPEAQVELERMLTCIRIAHSFLGACEAIANLFLAEIRDQVSGYIRRTTRGRSAADLNRLRTLALAIVSLTNFDLVALSEEDRRYFALFEKDSHLERYRALISNACDTLYNVQVAEQQKQDSHRSNVLGAILLLLTSLTVISVASDAYNFIAGQQALIKGEFGRLRIFVEFLFCLATLVTLVIYITWPGERRHHKR
jgi:hypothetical protein